MKAYANTTVDNARGLQIDIGNYNEPNTVAGQMYFGREHLATQKANVTELQNAVQSSNVTGSRDCRILRNDLVRMEYACYKPIYRWYVSLILIAIMLVFAFFFLLFICLGLGKEEDKPKKPEPRKPV